jgi:hypothetical protein
MFCVSSLILVFYRLLRKNCGFNVKKKNAKAGIILRNKKIKREKKKKSQAKRGASQVI